MPSGFGLGFLKLPLPPPGPVPFVDHLYLKMPDTTFVGVPTGVTVVAGDAAGDFMPDYTGTVTLTSSDTAAVLPASYTFTAADKGFHTFQVTLNTTGSQKVTAADKNSLTGTASTNVLAAPVADHLYLKIPDRTFIGVPTSVTVVAADASGDFVPDYTGTVTLTSSDTAAVLPASYTFTAADKGFHTFQVTLNTTGSQKVTAADKNSLTGSASTNVLTAPVADHLYLKMPDTTFVGVPTSVTVVALNATGNFVPDYTGTVTLTSSDTAAVLPASYTFTAADKGFHTFQVTLNTTGSQKVTATDKNSLTGTASINVLAAPVADHLYLKIPDKTFVGVPTSVTVVALDGSGNFVPDYAGTVTLTSSDTAAVLPASYTFTAADKGFHTFQVTLNTAGSQKVTATDKNSLTGSASINVLAAPVADHLYLKIPDKTFVGVPNSVTVVALDGSGNFVPDYAGTVTLTSSDTAAVLPASYTFTAADKGFHTFQVTLNTTGSQKVTATDKNSLTGSASINVLAAPVADHLYLKIPDKTFVGVPTSVTVVALDASGNFLPDYTGTVTLTSSDTAAVLPASYTFTAADKGFHAFQVTLNTTGSQTVTATDKNSLTGTATIDVLAAPVADHLYLKIPDKTFVGVPTSVTVVALDASGNFVPDYAGTVTLTSSDTAAVLPASYTFTAADKGFHTFQVTFNTTGSQKVTATDKNSLTGSASINVMAAPVANHLVIWVPKATAVGVPINVTVIAADQSGRPITNYTGTISFGSSDMAAILPAKYTFSASDRGRHTFQVTLNTPGTQTVTATDTATSSITGQGSVAVNAVGAVTHFAIISPYFAVAGFPARVKVVALDANNQIVAGYTGTVHFTSSDGSAIVPSDYTFVAGDHGSHDFSVSFKTAGEDTFTATDTSNSSLTGSTSVRVVSLPGKKHFPFGLGSKW